MKMKKIKSNEPHTRLTGKEFSPLIIRRYSEPILTFVALITDDNLDDLDKVVRDFFSRYEVEGFPKTIQGMRNIAGELTNVLHKRYEKEEGVAVVMYADKLVVSSLRGDFMNHGWNRLELFSLLNMATQV